MENTNEMTLEMDSRSCNEGLARITVAAFATQLNPTLEEVADIKTAVSEAITNCIVHAYEKETEKIRIDCTICGRELTVAVTDHGRGIESRNRTAQAWVLPLWRLSWICWKWNLSRERALSSG